MERVERVSVKIKKKKKKKLVLKKKGCLGKSTFVL